jgi:CDGSH-type Zn-finger protein
MKCCKPNIAKLKDRAAVFIERFSVKATPYQRLPRNGNGTLGDKWIDVAVNNAGVAATNRVARESKVKAGVEINWRDGSELLTLVNLPPPTPANQCVRITYDRWFCASAHVLMSKFVTYGRAQKFLNVFVKYNYCAERSGLATAWGRASWTLDYECALHPPIDQQVLMKLRGAWQKTHSWQLIKPILCNGHVLKAWSKLDRNEYWQILCLLRSMIIAMRTGVHPCGNDAFGPFCDGPHIKIPQDDFHQAVQAVTDEQSEDDPIVSALDLEMRGLWKPRQGYNSERNFTT